MGAALLSALQNSVGGGKATLKDRGDVVLAGTRRVFVHVARKENFPTSVPYVVGTFERERERKKGQDTEVEKARRRKRTSNTSTERKRKRELAREKDPEREKERKGKRGVIRVGGKKKRLMIQKTGSQWSSLFRIFLELRAPFSQS